MPIVLVPIYSPQVSDLEALSLDLSLPLVSHREVAFIGPHSLDRSYYAQRFPHIEFIGFDDAYFASIQGYNRLLLSHDFYRRFSPHECMLILQTDAILLRDDLETWCASAFDYVGAPWPDAVELFVNLDRFSGDKGRRVRASVGNGGLSLRRIDKCLALLDEFPQCLDYFVRSGSSEDLYFSLMGELSLDFVLPNEMTAAKFSLELKPAYYYAVNQGYAPMGGHAWWKYDVEFWRKLMCASSLAGQRKTPA